MQSKGWRVGIVGATGMVGRAFAQCLQSVPVTELRPFASAASIGKEIPFGASSVKVQALETNCFKGLDLVFFASSAPLALKWAPQALESGACVVDNSTAFRMDPGHVLCVPEVNGNLLPNKRPCLVSSPNCAAILLVLLLKPLQEAFGLDEVRTCTYQSVSGAGIAAQRELIEQSRALLDVLEQEGEERALRAGLHDHLNVKALPGPIGFNCLPQIGEFEQANPNETGLEESGQTGEEIKVVEECRKILNLPELPMASFCVRVPTFNSHAQLVWVRFKKEPQLDEVQAMLSKATGLEFKSRYPLQSHASGKAGAMVGRVHKLEGIENTWGFWLVGDNILKGAALNGLQIALKLER